MVIIAAMKVGKMTAKFETLSINGTYAGFEAAIHGMRMPLQSFHKADSEWKTEQELGTYFNIGPNDYDLAKRLRNAGPEHCKYLRMIPVWVDITAPEAWWVEFDTYKIGTTANSTSTMHTINRENLEEVFDFPFGVDQDADASFRDYLFAIQSIQLRMNECKDGTANGTYWYNKYHDLLTKMLPRSFVYTRTVCLNYAVLATMYNQRKNHRKTEWSEDFVNWIETLPYSEFITGKFE